MMSHDMKWYYVIVGEKMNIKIQRQKSWLIPLVSVAILGVVMPLTNAHAFFYPWCIGNGGGKFLCSDKDERMNIAKASAKLPYLEYVQQVFVANTIQYIPATDGSITAMTQHRGGGGINLSANTASSARENIRLAANEWFKFFCFANKGKTIRYPINDNADLINVDRLACHQQADAGEDVLAKSPMFGIQATRASAFGGIEDDPVIVMTHLGSGAEVKKRWGYPKVYKAGDVTNLGVVIEVKVPLAKIKQDSDGETTWVKLVELEPIGAQ